MGRKGLRLRILQISTVCGSGSVGRITVDIYHTLKRNQEEGLIAYGRGKAPEGVEAFKFGNPVDMGLHVLSTFFRGEHGFASAGPTRRLVTKIQEWNPDIIHLHNIHGFILQVELLFDYLKQAQKPVVWTLHDCWAYTGHCAFYDYHGCGKWKSGCKGCREYQKTYPYALLKDHTAQNFARKRSAFTGVPRLTVVVPSQWLAKEVKKSFLGGYPVEVVPNGIDLERFRPVDSGLRERLGLGGRFVLLGVANVWERRKGLPYLTALAEKLPGECRMVLIGLSRGQRRSLPSNVIGLGRVSGAEELAEYYSMADVFVNATLEDNFPTTNLEALACGTPVITFDTGGSPESLDSSCGRVVKKGDGDALLLAAMEEAMHPCERKACVEKARKYEKYGCFQEYVDLYHRLAG